MRIKELLPLKVYPFTLTQDVIVIESIAIIGPLISEVSLQLTFRK